jgi:hypothetical protein
MVSSFFMRKLLARGDEGRRPALAPEVFDMMVQMAVACADARAHRREAVSTEGALRGNEIRTLASVSDFSRHGARLLTAAHLMVGVRVTLHLPLLEKIHGTIVWAKDGEAGCKFDMSLPVSAFHPVLPLNGGKP